MKEPQLERIYSMNFNTWANETNKLIQTIKNLEVSEQKLVNFVYDVEFTGFKKGFQIASKIFQECNFDLSDDKGEEYGNFKEYNLSSCRRCYR